MILPRDFYQQNACEVARQLLGARLVRQLDGQRLAGIIVETEAYSGLDDLASHGRVGKTPRNLPMWEQPGQAYVYLCYGIYRLLNIVCEPVDQPAAVLIRAIEPTEGLDAMSHRRNGLPQKSWTSGPGRLTLALGIELAHNRADVTSRAAGLWIEAGESLPEDRIHRGPRIGMGKHVAEPWLSIPRRYWISDNEYVSR